MASQIANLTENQNKLIEKAEKQEEEIKKLN
jgi:hypothetical protein